MRQVGEYAVFRGGECISWLVHVLEEEDDDAALDRSIYGPAPPLDQGGDGDAGAVHLDGAAVADLDALNVLLELQVAARQV